MAKDKKVKKYQVGNLVEMMGEGTRGPNPEELPSEVMQQEQEGYLLELEEAQTPKKKKKKKKKKMGGGMLKYAYGGKVRGVGCARQGTRKAKMVKMKGS